MKSLKFISFVHKHWRQFMFFDNNQNAFNNDSQFKHIIFSDFMLLASGNEALVNNNNKKNQIQTSVSKKGNMPLTD